MKRIGLLGGMSWQSSLEYERTINQIVNEKLGGVASADLCVRSFNFQEIEQLQAQNNWDELAQMLVEAANQLQAAGAELLAICTNTMHKLAPEIENAIAIPLVHIADVVGTEIQSESLTKVALLGTKFTMEQGFYRDRLDQNFGIETIIPELEVRNEIHRIIYQELVRGEIKNSSRDFTLACIEDLQHKGAQGIIAGCTEIELLVKPSDVALPYFPSSYLHAKAIANHALAS